MHKILCALNEDQAQAAACTEGYIRVLAGAGTGKTKTLTSRYAYLIAALGISPRSALCVTFTNKAADEMKMRIRKICGAGIDPMVSTFHGFCCEFLRQESDALGRSGNFTLWDVADVKNSLKTVYLELGINGRQLSLNDAWEYIDKRKSSDLGYVEDLLCFDSSRLLKAIDDSQSPKEQIFYRYLFMQRTAGALDFDDLIAFTLYLLKSREDIREQWQKKLEYIMVDEFQDIDAQQYELVEILSAFHGNLFIVGDPDQTIYSFRGANVKFFIDFTAIHPEALSFVFTKNYRSSRDILDAAFSLISHNQDSGRKHLEAMRRDITMHDMVKIYTPKKVNDDEDEASALLQVMDEHSRIESVKDPDFKIVDDFSASMKPAIIHAANEVMEAEYIADEILELFSLNPHADVSVLYRATHVAGEIERAFIRHSIPYKIMSGTAFLDRAEIKTITSYLRLCLNPDDDLAFKRVVNEPRRGFGKKRLERLSLDAASDGNSLFSQLLHSIDDPKISRGTTVKQFVQKVLELNKQLDRLKPTLALELVLNGFLYEEHLKDSGDETRLEGITALRQLAYDFEENEGENTNIADFLSRVALTSNSDDHAARGVVKLMTVHASKGLEFDYVFLAGMTDGIFPSAKSATVDDIEEERRLMYVAMTRAKKQLFMTQSGGFSNGQQRDPSRFLSDIKEDLVIEKGGKINRGRFALSAVCDPSFKEGDRVFHEIFGPGIVLQVQSAQGEYEVKFDKLKQARTLSFNAPLQPFDNQP